MSPAVAHANARPASVPGFVAGSAAEVGPTVRRSGAGVSVAVRDVVEGPRRPGRVLGIFPMAVYVEMVGTGGLVLAVVSSSGIRLPNAAVVPGASGGVGRAVPGTRHVTADVGEGEIRVGSLRVTAARWWDPVPQLGAATVERLAGGVAAMRTLVRPGGLPARADATARGLESAVRRLDHDAAREIVPALLGAGAGLTPAGDDVLAGLLAGLRLLPPTLEGSLHLDRLADAVAAEALPAAPARTTVLSAALLAHAARGEVAEPVAAVLRALVASAPPGRPLLAPAVDRLQRIGHSSGRDLARGVLAAAEAVLAATGAATSGRQPA